MNAKMNTNCSTLYYVQISRVDFRHGFLTKPNSIRLYQKRVSGVQISRLGIQRLETVSDYIRHVFSACAMLWFDSCQRMLAFTSLYNRAVKQSSNFLTNSN